jgi:hypothetical protein
LAGAVSVNSLPTFLALHRDGIMVARGRIAAQRIFAQESVRDADRHVGAGGEFRQITAVGRAEFIEIDVARDLLGAGDAQRHVRWCGFSGHGADT